VNDYIYGRLSDNPSGLMISKFSTVELDAISCFKRNQRGLKFSDYLDYVKGNGVIFSHEACFRLTNNAFFDK
jgi:hypothetical protein